VRLVAVYGRTASGARRTAWVLRSADDGKSWQFVTMAEPNDRYGYSETALGEALDGTIVAMLRTEPDECGYLHVSRSTDGGLTWSAPLNTGIWGHPANLLTLPDGRILCTYGYRRGAMGVRACLSADNGVTWDTDHTILLRTDGVGSGSDLGYPISTLLPDGRVLTIYYITLADQVTSIACTRWRVPPK
jgi:predicted neuraminidase